MVYESDSPKLGLLNAGCNRGMTRLSIYTHKNSPIVVKSQSTNQSLTTSILLTVLVGRVRPLSLYPRTLKT